MELSSVSTIINAESSLHKLLFLRFDVAMLASTLANVGAAQRLIRAQEQQVQRRDD